MKYLSKEEFLNLSDNARNKYVYDLFFLSDNEKEIKKLFLLNTKEKFDSHLLMIALTATIKQDQRKYFNVLIDFMDRNKKSICIDVQRALLNLSLLEEKFFFANEIEERFKVLKTEVSQQRYICVDQDGKLKDNGYIGESYLSESLDSFAPLDGCYRNVFIAQLESHHLPGIDYILDKIEQNNYHFNTSLLESAFISSLLKNDTRATSILLNIHDVRKTLENSELIQKFLSEDSELTEIKEKIKRIIKILNLKNKMDNELPEKEKANKNKV